MLRNLDTIYYKPDLVKRSQLKLISARTFFWSTEAVNSMELGGHQWGGQILNMRVVVALRSSAVFRAGGKEKLLVLLTL